MSDDKEARDVQRVLDIAYGRDVALDNLANMAPQSLGNGVWRVERIHGTDVTYWHAPELSLRNLPPDWQVQRGTWSSGRYRK